MEKKLIIITAFNKFFGQTRKPWVSMNIDKVIEKFRELGIEVERYEFHQIANGEVKLENETILYTFSQRENYRQYVKDVIFHLSKNNRIIPSYDLLLCHENKGYQELYKKRLGIRSLDAKYYTSADEVDYDKIDYPIVLKTCDGSNGKGVFLAKSKSELEKHLKDLRYGLDFFKRTDLLRRKYLRKKKFENYPDHSNKKDYEDYKKYIIKEKNFILQQFIPNLQFDYRVLILFDKYYVTKRLVKKNSFKASGSKLFTFDKTPDQNLLNYAKEIYSKFDTPFLSIDILFDGENYYLCEYQALHFGINVFVKSEGYFSLDNEWKFIEEKPDIIDSITKSLAKYLEQ